MKAKDLKVGDTIYLVFEGNQVSPRNITKIETTQFESDVLVGITINSPYHRKDGFKIVVKEDDFYGVDVESKFAFVACFDIETAYATKFCFKPASYKIDSVSDKFSGKDIMELLVATQFVRKNEHDDMGYRLD